MLNAQDRTGLSIYSSIAESAVNKVVSPALKRSVNALDR